MMNFIRTALVVFLVLEPSLASVSSTTQFLELGNESQFPFGRHSAKIGRVRSTSQKHPVSDSSVSDVADWFRNVIPKMFLEQAVAETVTSDASKKIPESNNVVEPVQPFQGVAKAVGKPLKLSQTTEASNTNPTVTEDSKLDSSTVTDESANNGTSTASIPSTDVLIVICGGFGLYTLLSIVLVTRAVIGSAEVGVDSNVAGPPRVKAWGWLRNAACALLLQLIFLTATFFFLQQTTLGLLPSFLIIDFLAFTINFSAFAVSFRNRIPLPATVGLLVVAVVVKLAVGANLFAALMLIVDQYAKIQFPARSTVIMVLVMLLEIPLNGLLLDHLALRLRGPRGTHPQLVPISAETTEATVTSLTPPVTNMAKLSSPLSDAIQPVKTAVPVTGTPNTNAAVKGVDTAVPVASKPVVQSKLLQPVAKVLSTLTAIPLSAWDYGVLGAALLAGLGSAGIVGYKGMSSIGLIREQLDIVPKIPAIVSAAVMCLYVFANFVISIIRFVKVNQTGVQHPLTWFELNGKFLNAIVAQRRQVEWIPPKPING